jgi:hypothetical protein
VSSNYNIPIDFILQNITWYWNWADVIAREDITQSQFATIFEMIKPDYFATETGQENIGDRLSTCKHVNWDFIKTHMDIKWNWGLLSMHPQIDIKTIIDNPQHKWDWKIVSQNPNLQWTDVVSNIDKPWSWSNISLHKNITWDVIKKNKNRPWCWKRVSMNLNIGWDTITQNKNIPWDFEKIIVNTMPRYKSDWISETRLKWIATRRIQRYWRKVIFDPSFCLCKKKLERVYSD